MYNRYIEEGHSSCILEKQIYRALAVYNICLEIYL